MEAVRNMKSREDIQKELDSIKIKYTERAQSIARGDITPKLDMTMLQLIQNEEWARMKMLEWVLS